MSKPLHLSLQHQIARVVRLSRRYVDIMLEDGVTVRAISESQTLNSTVGDLIRYEIKQEDFVVNQILQRKNCIERSYQSQTKQIAANVDIALIISAITPLFNTTFIDRVLVETLSQNIESMLVINKSDLATSETTNLGTPYHKIGIPTINTSTITGDGLQIIKECLNQPNISVVALLGISGVGKSSILNSLIPEAERPTQEVSQRTGQGRQTTSQSVGYSLSRESLPPLLLIDSPGLSNFGLAHHSKENIRQYFPEFKARLSECQYSSCLHMEEPDCAVKRALNNNQIDISRYQSYIDIIQEIESSKEY